MLKTLLKKELLAILAFFTIGKNGKRRSAGVMAGFALLMLYAFGAMVFMFWEMSKMLCAPLVTTGQAWIYFSVMGLMATSLGVIGDIFMAKSKLYEAKDNDLLLSMPISAWKLLAVRTIGLYAFTFVFEGLVFLPAVVQYFTVVGAQWQAVIGCVVVTLLMPFLALAVCCLLGFVMAWMLGKLPYKNLFAILGFLAFMIVYFLLYSKIYDALNYVIINGEAVGAMMQTALFPFAQLGKAAIGNGVSLLWFLLVFVGAFAVVYGLLSVTYLRIVTAKKGERYAKYKATEHKVSSPRKTLLKREFLRLFKSPGYFLNASMGTFMTLLVVIMAVIQGDVFGMTAETLQTSGFIKIASMILPLALCFLASSNTLTAVSVSLEGETLWQLRSLPVKTQDVLNAKLLLHFIMTAVPVALCGCGMGIVLKLAWYHVVFAVLTGILASAFFAEMGLMINLKFPNLHWTNEMVAVKQSLSAVFAMFGGWGVSLLPLGGYFLFGKYMPAWGYVALWLGIFALATTVLWLCIKKWGTLLFESLS